MRCLVTLIVAVSLLVAAGAPAQGQAAEVTPEQVRAAIDKGVAALRKSGVFNKKARYGVGMNALAITAMLQCGVPPTDPDIQRAAAICADPKNWMANTYHVGCIAQALAAVDRKKYYKTIKKCSDWLVGAQNKDGGWRYQSANEYAKRMAASRKAWEKRVKQNPKLKRFARNWNTRSNQMSDHSCTQFGLLGLRAADDIGIAIPKETWAKAAKYLVDTQAKDGGWAYTNPPKAPARTRKVGGRVIRYGGTYGSMSAAGLGSLYICGMKLHEKSTKCGQYTQNKRIAKGLDWLAKNFSVKDNPGRGTSYVSYYLYAMERCCAFSARKYIGKHDWYREGATHLVSTQAANGSWSKAQGRFAGRFGFGDLDTVFNLLFLGKASSKVLIQKLEYGPYWNTDLYDAEHLAKQTGRELDLQLTWQVVRPTDSVDIWLEAPILYITGHGTPKFTDVQRKKIREFCERGGTIVADACCSNRTFDTAFRAEMAKIFPTVPLAKLPEEHPVYAAPHKITAQKSLVWEGITTGCRTAVFYSKKDLSCGWDGNIHNAAVSLDEKNALRVGVNVAAYAMGYKPVKDKLDEVEGAIAKKDVEDDGRVARGALVFAQLKHDGDWDPDPSTTRNLLHLYAKATGARVNLKRVDVEPTDADLYKYPLTYITGHRKFEYKEPQIKALQQYFARGGVLLADSCCGRKKFDDSFRQLMKQVFPKQALEKLPLDHKIFRMKYRINRVKYRPILEKELPEAERSAPALEVVVVDGRVAVVYSKYDFGCAFEGFPCAACRGLELSSAKQLVTNILLYAMIE
jgi:uncharacterized protein DUF4159